MNNNNRGNNRRRGRGNNRQQGGGGQQVNRIDSRARGNAPQLLEKYRKLAHDAHLNGDRVTEEYNLQFADHYFRVIADQRVRQDEQRQNRPGGQAPGQERWQEGGDNDRFGDDSAGEYGADNDYPSSTYGYGERRDREDAPRYDDRRENQAAPSEARAAPAPAPAPAAQPAEEPAGDEAAATFEPAQNPFTRDNRGTRGLKQRRPRRESGAQPQSDGTDDAPPQLDLTALPPAISPREEAPADADEPAAEAKPKRRVTRRKKPEDDAGEALQVVS